MFPNVILDRTLLKWLGNPKDPRDKILARELMLTR
jgi:hypothetical protein